MGTLVNLKRYNGFRTGTVGLVQGREILKEIWAEEQRRGIILKVAYPRRGAEKTDFHVLWVSYHDRLDPIGQFDVVMRGWRLGTGKPAIRDLVRWLGKRKLILPGNGLRDPLLLRYDPPLFGMPVSELLGWNS